METLYTKERTTIAHRHAQRGRPVAKGRVWTTANGLVQAKRANPKRALSEEWGGETKEKKKSRGSTIFCKQ